MKLNEAKLRCPRCRSIQKFSPQRRYGTNSDIFEIIVKCKVCRKTIELEKSTDEIENLKKLIKKVEKHKPSESSLNLLNKYRERLYNLRAELNN